MRPGGTKPRARHSVADRVKATADVKDARQAVIGACERAARDFATVGMGDVEAAWRRMEEIQAKLWADLAEAQPIPPADASVGEVETPPPPAPEEPKPKPKPAAKRKRKKTA